MSTISLTPYVDKAFNNNKGESIPYTNLQELKLVVYYVGAKWCSGCTKFTPLLLDFYQQINKDTKNLEIVYISCDNIETDYKAQIESMPWLSAPFNVVAQRKFLDENTVTTMPSVLVLRKDATVAKKDGRADVQLHGVKCFEEWVKLSQISAPTLLQ